MIDIVFIFVTKHVPLVIICEPAHHLYMRGARQASGGMYPPTHRDKEGAKMAPISVHDRRNRMDHCDDALRIMVVCVWRLKQLCWVQDVHVRWLLPDEHEHHHRLLLRYIAGLHTLEYPDESEIKVERPSSAWYGGIVSYFQL